jgi:O-antigen ligase
MVRVACTIRSSLAIRIPKFGQSRKRTHRARATLLNSVLMDNPTLTLVVVLAGLAYLYLSLRATTYALAALILVAPLHTLPSVSADTLRLAKEAMSLLIIAGWVIARASRPVQARLPNPILPAMIPYAALLLVSTVFSQSIMRSVLTALSDLVLMTLFFVFLNSVGDNDGRRVVLGAMVISLGAGALAAALQIVAHIGGIATLVSPSALLSLSLPLSVSMFFGATTPLQRYAWATSAALSSLVLLVSDHRGTVAAIGGATLLVVVRNVRWRALWLPAIGAVGVLLLGVDSLTAYLRTGSGLTGRAELWQAAVGIFWDHPVIGSGPGTFSSLYFAYQPSLQALPLVARPIGILPHAHNILLNALAELGALGPFAVLLLVGAILVVAYRSASVLATSPQRLLSFGLFASLLGMACQELTESGTIFRHGSENIYFWAMAAMAVALWQSVAGRRPLTESGSVHQNSAGVAAPAVR